MKTSIIIAAIVLLFGCDSSSTRSSITHTAKAQLCIDGVCSDNFVVIPPEGGE
uniref:Lipoprotein n=1 Tax=viral metagenome TaxID=1070528 RepID=A0A6M3J3X6_9ZZZZ